MIKTYSFVYGTHEAEVVFKVDTKKFTSERANETLTFFSWDYDKEADPVDEVMKKYAMQAIEFSTFNRHNELGVIEDFVDAEGYYRVDGPFGITLISIEGYEFDDSALSMEVS